MRWLKIERICRRYPGWTLEYVRALSVQDTHRIFGLIEAENELAKIEREQAKQRAGRRGRRR